MERPLTLALLSFVVPMALACSCFGPQTFCETLDPQPPQFPEPQWWVPSDIVRVVKINSVQYGVTVRIIESFHGSLQPGQEIRVWGDCGLLCRHYVDGLPNGDTLLWALQHCDLSGNGPCGTNLEAQGDYQLSVCGVYWLTLSNGMVSGPLYTAGANETVSLAEFQALVDGCLATGVPERNAAAQLEVRTSDLGPVIAMPTPGTYALTIFDTGGRAVLARPWNGSPLPLTDLPSGAFIIQVVTGRGMASRKLVTCGERR